MPELSDNVFDIEKARDTLKRLEREKKQKETQATFVQEEWESSMRFDEKGNLDRKAGSNVTLVLSNHEQWKGKVAFDEFSERIVIRHACPAGHAGEQWSDAHDKLTADWLERSRYNLRPGKNDVFDTINIVARANVYNPVTEYLEGLAWDATPRVDSLVTTYLGAACNGDDAGLSRYLAKVSSVLLVGAVARAMQPGCMLKTVVILEGEQDAGKSTAIRALSPRPEWFSDSEIHFGSKDAYQELHGKWLIELAEIDKVLGGKTSQAIIKAFVSSRSDNYREPYGRRAVDHPRRSSFVGSTNQYDYLTDETGGSRWLPVKIGGIDVAAIERDRDQLWAEALVRFKAGEAWWIDDTETVAFARKEQADRYSEDVWKSAIVGQINAYELRSDLSGSDEMLTTEVVLGGLGLAVADQTKADQMRVAATMKDLGYEHVRSYLEGRRVRHWRIRLPDLGRLPNLAQPLLARLGDPADLGFPMSNTPNPTYPT